jgi:copper transport protein
MRVWGRVLGVIGGGLVLVGLTAPATPAGAHARVVGSSPEAGATVDRVPGEVVLDIDAKPATIEGDPLQVWAPDGRRVDADDPHVSEDGRRLAVSVDPGRDLPAGEYEIAYRLVSADSHVIAGRLSFTARLPVTAAGSDAAAAVGAGTDLHLSTGGPDDHAPPLVAAGATLLALVSLVVRRLWRRRQRRVAAAAAGSSARTRPRRQHVPPTRRDRPPGSYRPQGARPGRQPERRPAARVEDRPWV